DFGSRGKKAEAMTPAGRSALRTVKVTPAGGVGSGVTASLLLSCLNLMLQAAAHSLVAASMFFTTNLYSSSPKVVLARSKSTPSRASSGRAGSRLGRREAVQAGPRTWEHRR